MDNVKNAVITFISFIILDYLWLGLIAKNFMSGQLSYIARMEGSGISPFMPSAIVVYLIMTLALEVFIFHGMGSADIWRTAGYSALLGFCLYAVFDFTNHAIIKGYPVAFLIVDIAAGTLLFGLVSMISFYLRRL